MLIYNEKYNTSIGNDINGCISGNNGIINNNNSSFIRINQLQGICLFVISQECNNTFAHDDIGINSITQMNNIGCDLMSLLDESVSTKYICICNVLCV